MTRQLKARTRAVIKQAFLAIGLDIRRIERETSTGPPRVDPPQIFEDPLEALHFARGGMPGAFHCPIDDCCLLNGLRFRRAGWNPFSANVSQILGGQCNGYAGSPGCEKVLPSLAAIPGNHRPFRRVPVH